MNRKKERAIVAGRNYGNILTMTRALGQAGYEVEVFRIYKKKPSPLNPLVAMKPDAYSRYVNRFHECIVDGHEIVVINKLKDMGEEGNKALLMPVDDYSACVIDEHLEELMPYFHIPNAAGRTGEISRLMDKYEQKRIAAEFSLPMLHSVLVKSRGGCFELPDDIRYPCFIKPNVSMKSTKGIMMKCDDESQLISVLTRYAQKEDIEILVEEYADIAAEYSVLGISTADGISAPGLFKAIMGGHKERKGVAVMGQLMDPAPFSQIIDQCNQYIQSLNYTGLFDVDLIETKDGNVYFVELNFRAGASAHILTELGINLPGMLADYMVRKKQIDYDIQLKEFGKRFVSEKVLLEEYVRSDVDYRQMRQCLNEADVYFIRDAGDRKPYQKFKLFYPIAAMLRIPYRIRDRKR